MARNATTWNREQAAAAAAKSADVRRFRAAKRAAERERFDAMPAAKLADLCGDCLGLSAARAVEAAIVRKAKAPRLGAKAIVFLAEAARKLHMLILHEPPLNGTIPAKQKTPTVPGPVEPLD